MCLLWDRARWKPPPTGHMNFTLIVTRHDAIFEFSFQLFGDIKSHGQYLTSDCSLTRISMVLRGRRRPGGAVLSGSPQVHFAMAECIPYSYRVHTDAVCQAGSCSHQCSPEAHLQRAHTLQILQPGHPSMPLNGIHIQQVPRCWGKECFNDTVRGSVQISPSHVNRP